MGAISAAPLTGAKGRNRQIVPKMGLNSHCENARQASGCRTLRNPKVLASVSNGQREALRNWEDTVSGHKGRRSRMTSARAVSTRRTRTSIRHRSPAPCRSLGSQDAPARTQGTSPGRKLGHRLRGHPQPKPGRCRQWGSDRETAA